MEQDYFEVPQHQDWMVQESAPVLWDQGGVFDEVLQNHCGKVLEFVPVLSDLVKNLA